MIKHSDMSQLSASIAVSTSMTMVMATISDTLMGWPGWAHLDNMHDVVLDDDVAAK